MNVQQWSLGRLILGVAVLLTNACTRTPAPVTEAHCGGALSDSARAVCRALDTLDRGYQLPSRVLTIERLADTLHIRTVPTNPTVVDGMGLVIVAPGGTVLKVVVSDSL